MEELREKLKARIADVQTWYSRLSERDRKLVTFGSPIAAVIVLMIVLASFASSASATRKRIAQKQASFAQVQVLSASYREAEAARQAVERQLTGNNLRLTSFVEEKATAAGLEVPTMNPRAEVPIGDGNIIENSIDVTLADISLLKLVDFLQNVERGPGVIKVKRLRLEPRPANENLTVNATIATYRMKQ
jgi:general secretion pathway protein M